MRFYNSLVTSVSSRGVMERKQRAAFGDAASSIFSRKRMGQSSDFFGRPSRHY